MVEAMKRVIDKLRTENEQLKKNAHSSRQYMNAVNKVKELKKQVETLQEEKSKAESQEVGHTCVSQYPASLVDVLIL